MNKSEIPSWQYPFTVMLHCASITVSRRGRRHFYHKPSVASRIRISQWVQNHGEIGRMLTTNGGWFFIVDQERGINNETT